MSPLNAFAAKLLLSHECDVFSSYIRPFTVSLSQAEMHCFADLDITAGKIVGYYYGTLTYLFMVIVFVARGVHGKNMKPVIWNQSNFLSKSLAKDVTSSYGNLYTIWLMPAWFVCLRSLSGRFSLSSEAILVNKNNKHSTGWKYYVCKYRNSYVRTAQIQRFFCGSYKPRKPWRLSLCALRRKTWVRNDLQMANIIPLMPRLVSNWIFSAAHDATTVQFLVSHQMRTT